ncbi:MAG: glycosyltransferase family 39 protein [Deltaproteobacteria bacterium]|nr:glycosyltransferase family 39 protein [Deltaproteobacteria bacterium]
MPYLLRRVKRFRILLDLLPLAPAIAVFVFLASYKIEKLGFFDEEILLYSNDYPRTIKGFRNEEGASKIIYDNTFYNGGGEEISGIVLSETRPVLSIKSGDTVYPLLCLSHAAAYPVLIGKALGGILGADDMSFYRRLSIFWGAVTIILLYLVVLKLTCSKTAAFIIAAVMATSSLFVFLHRIAVVYESFPLAMTAASALAFIHAFHKGSRLLLVSGFFFLSIAVATKLTHAAAIFSFLAGLILLKRDLLKAFLRKIDVGTALLSAVFSFVVFSPYFLLLAAGGAHGLDVFSKEKGALDSIHGINAGFFAEGILNFFRAYLSGVGNFGEDVAVLTGSKGSESYFTANFLSPANNVIYGFALIYVLFETFFRRNRIAGIFLFLLLGQIASWFALYGGKENSPQVFFLVIPAIFAALTFMILSLGGAVRAVFRGGIRDGFLQGVLCLLVIVPQSALHLDAFDAFERISNPVFSRDFEDDLVEKLRYENVSYPIFLMQKKSGVVERLTGGRIRPIYAGGLWKCESSGKGGCIGDLLAYFGDGTIVIPEDGEKWSGLGEIAPPDRMGDAVRAAAEILDKRLTIKNNVYCGQPGGAVCAVIYHFDGAE